MCNSLAVPISDALGKIAQFIMSSPLKNSGASTISSRLLAAGEHWRITSVECKAGPPDRAYEEQHADACIALVTRGSFTYQAVHAKHTLASGAFLLGNVGACFKCGHEHSWGDHCLSFHYAPTLLEDVAAATPGARSFEFSRDHISPNQADVALTAYLVSTLMQSDIDNQEGREAALRLAAWAIETATPVKPARKDASTNERKRVAQALRRIEAQYSTRLTLDDLAEEAALTPCHFLRVFRRQVGMTPYQYLLRTRLHQAALALRKTHYGIARVALEAGFEDLSTFNHRFHRLFGMRPGEWRK